MPVVKEKETGAVKAYLPYGKGGVAEAEQMAAADPDLVVEKKIPYKHGGLVGESARARGTGAATRGCDFSKVS